MARYYTDAILEGKYKLDPDQLVDNILFLVLRNLVNESKSEFDPIKKYRLEKYRKLGFLTLVSSEEEISSLISTPSELLIKDKYLSGMLFVAAEVSKSQVRVVAKALVAKGYRPQYLMNMCAALGESPGQSTIMEWYEYYKGPNCDYSYWNGPVVGIIGPPHKVKLVFEILAELGASLDVSKGVIVGRHLDNIKYIEWVLDNDDDV